MAAPSSFESDIARSRSSTDVVDCFIQEQKKKTTINTTKSHLKMVISWLENKGENREINTIPPEELNQYLCEFFVTLKKQDNSDYEPSTIECIKSSIEKHLREKYYPFSIITDRAFSKLRDALKAKKN